ncbi:MAG: NarK family nitrate/nitrite MFS transporter [Proteobacteria bacterium]|nr:NarK family nitrate/nitrite MFS transporter [Pseudomonadota bacterium]MCP4916423.1 NarK family nitrate/nitrite MFS transporter [Pseudomonadota bacterium]
MSFLSFQGPNRILHLTWFAFFLTFLAWFNLAPLATTLSADLGLSRTDVDALLICNVALTIPARVVIGMLLDRFGPRRIYSALLWTMAVPCVAFAMSDTMTQLVITRLMLGCIGAGFVVGIRMVGEWFPREQVGTANGIYGGFGNFGSAAAAFLLPVVALQFVEDGWRYAIALTGLACFGYGFVYWAAVTDTPEGQTYERPRRHGALEVSSWASLGGLMVMQLPLAGALALLVWKLGAIGYLEGTGQTAAYGVIAALLLLQLRRSWTVNAPQIRAGIPEDERYAFRQVAILEVAYLVTFGSELAVVSILPRFFEETWSLAPAAAGALAASYASMNLLARPLGGWMSDRLGSRKLTLFVLIVGLAGGYAAMSELDASWPLPAAIALVMACSFCVQAGEGAVHAIVPLVKRRLTGQVAGMVGAYGTAGAVAFLTVQSEVADIHTFFAVIAGAAVLSAASILALKPVT